MLKLQSPLMALILVMSVFVQAQEQDALAAFEGKWKHTKLYCRSFNAGIMSQYEGRLIPGDPSKFYPDVELKFSTVNLNINGKIVPAKNLEKAVTQGSCKVDKPTISPLNQKDHENYVWSNNRIRLTPSANIQGIQYYEMDGYVLDKKINYNDIKDCGRKDGQLLSMRGVFSVLLTLFRYEFGKSYFDVEADRKYTVSTSNNKLNLEFFDASICSNSNERVVMQFEKDP